MTTETLSDEEYTCCLCGDACVGYGNNPSPLDDKGRCCDVCNATKVIPARIRDMKEDLEIKNE